MPLGPEKKVYLFFYLMFTFAEDPYLKLWERGSVCTLLIIYALDLEIQTGQNKSQVLIYKMVFRKGRFRTNNLL